MIIARRAVWALALCLAACSLDARTLHTSGGQGGSAGDSARGGVSASAGNGGGASNEMLVDGCADLDTDGVADCAVTLLGNASFTSDVDGWAASTGATLAWDPRNALADAPSGSLALGSQNARASASQCVALSGSELVIVYANVFVPAASANDAAQAVLDASFFEQANCQGERARYFETPPNGVNGAWVTVQAGGLARDTTKSLLLELVGIKAASASSFEVYFDNVMLKTQSP